MGVIGLVNVAIFVLLLVKCGLGKGIGYLLGNVFIVGLTGIAAFVVVWIFTRDTNLAKYACALTEIVTTVIRMKTALDDIKRGR